jgi:hypothetical protein
MCQILVGTGAKIAEFASNVDALLSVFKYNSDGLGAMYRNRKGLRIVKALPKSFADAQKFFATLPDDDRNVVVHARLATHGTVNTDNCHPYDVVKGKLAMVHNGVLASGNAADKTKSDTWHFVQDFLAEPCSHATEIVHTQGFINMVGEFIENNRFVFMTEDGRVSIVNKDQGIEYGGLWFANTYAWDPSTFIPTYQRSVVHGYGKYSNWGSEWDKNDWEDYYRARGWTSAGTSSQYAGGTTPTLLTHSSRKRWDHTAFLDAVHAGEVDVVTDFLESHHARAISLLLDTHKARLTRSVSNDGGMTSLSATYEMICVAAMASDSTALIDVAATRASKVAECFCYFLDWEDQVEADEDEDAPTDTYRDCAIYVTREGTKERAVFGYTITSAKDGELLDADSGYADADAALEEAYEWIDSSIIDEDDDVVELGLETVTPEFIAEVQRELDEQNS